MNTNTEYEYPMSGAKSAWKKYVFNFVHKLICVLADFISKGDSFQIYVLQHKRPCSYPWNMQLI